MPALVLEGPGHAEVEEVPVPRLGPTTCSSRSSCCGICGSDLHMVLEGWGAPGSGTGHEWIGIVAAVGDGVTDWRPGDAVVGGPAAALRQLPDVQGRPAVAVRGRRHARHRTEHRAPSPPTSGPGRRCWPLPDGPSTRGRPRWPSRWPSPSTASTRAASQPGDRVLVLGAGPIGAARIAALRAIGRRRRAPAPSPPRAARRSPPPSAPPGCSTPTSSTCRPSPSPACVVDDAVDVVLECSGKAKAMEAGLASSRGPAPSCWSAPGIEPPRFDPNRILLNELVDHRRLHLRPRRLRAGPRACSPPAGSPSTTSSNPTRCPLDGVLDAMRGLAEGGSPARCWCGHDRAHVRQAAAVQPRRACRCRPTPSTPTAAAAICAFYGDVFGFEEYPTITEDRRRLVLRRAQPRAVRVPHRRGRADGGAPRRPLRPVRLDEADFEEVARRAAAWKERLPDDVDLDEPRSRSTPGCSSCTASTSPTACRSWWRSSGSSGSPASRSSAGEPVSLSARRRHRAAHRRVVGHRRRRRTDPRRPRARRSPSPPGGPTASTPSLATLPGSGHVALPADLADPAAGVELAERAAAAIGPLDVIVHNAGMPKRRQVADLTVDGGRRGDVAQLPHARADDARHAAGDARPRPRLPRLRVEPRRPPRHRPRGGLLRHQVRPGGVGRGHGHRPVGPTRRRPPRAPRRRSTPRSGTSPATTRPSTTASSNRPTTVAVAIADAIEGDVFEVYSPDMRGIVEWKTADIDAFLASVADMERSSA